MRRNSFNGLILLSEEALELNMRKAEKSCDEAVGAAVHLTIRFRIMTGASYLDLIIVYKVCASTLYEIVDRNVDVLLKVLPMTSLPVEDNSKLYELSYVFSKSRRGVSPLGAALVLCMEYVHN